VTKKNEDEDKEQSKKKYRVEVIQFGTFGQGFPDAEELEDALNTFSSEGRKVEIMTIGQRGLLVLGTKPDPDPLASLLGLSLDEAPSNAPAAVSPQIGFTFAKLLQEFNEQQQTKTQEQAAEVAVQTMMKHVDLELARQVASYIETQRSAHAEQHPPDQPCHLVKDLEVLHAVITKAINANVS